MRLFLLLLSLASCHPGPKPTDSGDDTGPADCVPSAVGWGDADGDGYGDPATLVDSCDPAEEQAGAVDDDSDCDDADPAIHPGADEHCDGMDEDCDGAVDEEPVDPATWYPDGDGDGYAASEEGAVQACSVPSGYTDQLGDCDDGAATVHPGAEEIPCNGTDDDCDGVLLEGDAPAWIGGVPYDTVQLAGDAVQDGDTLWVCAGSWWVGLETEGITWTLAAANADPATTALHGSGINRILAVHGGGVTLRDLTLRAGEAWDQDGGALAADDAEVVVEGCLFSGNRAATGGAIQLVGASGLTITDSAFEDNAAQEGGAILFGSDESGVDVAVRDTRFTSNAAESAGGAISFGDWESVALTLEGCAFEGNTAEAGGAVAFAPVGDGGTLTVEGCSFDGNAATAGGGALSVGSWGTTALTLTDSTFNGNAADDGGALRLFNDLYPLRITGCRFESNQAGDGGAVDADLRVPTVAEIANTEFVGNEAGYYGGALRLTASAEVTVALNGTTLQDNEALQGASGIEATTGYTEGSLALTLSACIVRHNLNSGTPLNNSAVGLQRDTNLVSDASDWGTGDEDNRPYDVWAGRGYDWEGEASFSCDATSGCR